MLFIFISCLVPSGSGHNSEYVDQVLKERTSKDSTFKLPESSPLAEEYIDSFKGLKYFPVNEDYKFGAAFTRVYDQSDFFMKTTTDRLPVYRKYADVSFILFGNDIKLEVYQNVELIKREGYDDYLFLPFTDETSGVESYGGGRYLDIRIPTGDSIEIDFNMAYNPYCNYSERYSCPVPPPQNDIPLRIEAGEMNFH